MSRVPAWKASFEKQAADMSWDWMKQMAQGIKTDGDDLIRACAEKNAYGFMSYAQSVVIHLQHAFKHMKNPTLVAQLEKLRQAIEESADDVGAKPPDQG